MTNKQTRQRGGYIRPGKKATKVVLWKPFEVKTLDEGTAEEVTKTIPLLRCYSVFKIEQ